ncbi:MAG: hypothetical protein ACR2OY_07635 [Boseongicola sp.]
MYQTRYYFSRGVLPAMIVAICGGACWLAISQSETPPGIGDLFTMVRLTTAAAAVGGIVASPLFGSCGGKGLAFALFGAVFATVIGAALAAAAIGGLPGIVIGPIFVLTKIATEPHVGGIWLILMVAAHCAAETERARP